MNGNLTKIDTIKLKRALLQAGQHIVITTTSKAYENLVGSGAFHFIEDNDLKDKLSNYYRVDLSQKINEEQRTRYSNEYYNLRYNHIDPKMLRDELTRVLGLEWEKTRPLGVYQVNWENLREDIRFKLALGKCNSQRPHELYNLSARKSMVIELMELVESKMKMNYKMR